MDKAYLYTIATHGQKRCKFYLRPLNLRMHPTWRWAQNTDGWLHVVETATIQWGSCHRWLVSSAQASSYGYWKQRWFETYLLESSSLLNWSERMPWLWRVSDFILLSLGIWAPVASHSPQRLISQRQCTQLITVFSWIVIATQIRKMFLFPIQSRTLLGIVLLSINEAYLIFITKVITGFI